MMKNRTLILLAVFLVLLVAVNECLTLFVFDYFDTGLWVILLTAAIVFASLIMVKYEKILLPKLLVSATMSLKYVVMAIVLAVTSEISLDPVSILIDIIFKTAVVIIPAFIIFGIAAAINCIKVLRKIK